MIETNGLRLCLVGLPSTGKTTYIAALWAYLTSGLESGGFRVTEYPDDPSYLNQIAQAWAEGKPMPRNSLGTSDRIEFTVESPLGAQITVVLPDLPGEVFRNAVARPMIDTDTADAVDGSDLLLFFVNGESAKSYAAIGDYAPVGSREQGELASAALPAREFAAEDLDSDTLNSELLHRLSFLTRDRNASPILVVVSAWDIHHGSQESPQAWLEREQPMLAQLVAEYGRTTAAAVIGVSAQGANYNDDPHIVTKAAHERSWACDTTGDKTDITGPLVWYDGL